MAKKRRHLGGILYRNGVVGKEDLIKALKKSKAESRRFGETLVDMGLASEDDIAKALAKQFGLEYVDLDDGGIDMPLPRQRRLPQGRAGRL